MQELDRAFLLAALDGLNTNICITDTVTNRIVYANENMKRIFGLAEPEGRICWEVLQDGMDGLCPFCRIRRLQAMGGEQSCVWDEMNTLTGRTYKNFDCLIRWEGQMCIRDRCRGMYLPGPCLWRNLKRCWPCLLYTSRCV